MWVPLAGVGAVAIACCYWGVYLRNVKSLTSATAVYGNLWMAYAAVESFCLLGDWRRRVLWMALGGAAGVMSNLAGQDYQWFVLGLAMSAVCFRVRRRAWAWIFAMPLLHYSFGYWANDVYGWAGKLHSALQANAPAGLTLPRRVFGVTAWLFVLLAGRAVVGAFVVTPAGGEGRGTRGLGD